MSNGCGIGFDVVIPMAQVKAVVLVGQTMATAQAFNATYCCDTYGTSKGCDKLGKQWP